MKPSRIVALAVIAALAWWWWDHALFVKRYASYLSGGYDAHTVPIEWFEPLAELAHGAGSVPPVADPPDIPAAVLDEVIAYADQQDSMALIVLRNGEIQLEKYWSGYDRNSLFNPQSMSKTVLGMAVGIAIADGALASVDDRIADYVDEWRDDSRGEIRIRHLLQMSGGLAQISNDYRPVPWSKAVWQHFNVDFNRAIFRLPQADPPGEKFDYNNNENNLLGVVLERATGEKYQDYLGRKIWAAADLAPAFMYLDRPGGNVMKSCCLLSRPIDWAVLGQIMLDDGRLGDRQILPPGWVAEMTTPASTTDSYGYQVWLAADMGANPYGDEPDSTRVWWASEPFASDDVFQFLGHGFQHVWVVPSLELVIVRANRVWPDEPWDQTRIPNLLIRGLREQAVTARHD
jgi:CubicO group peptidase (beta-lactamase class C family)